MCKWVGLWLFLADVGHNAWGYWRWPLMLVFSMVYSLEDAIVICRGFPTITRRAMCIARGIKGHAWQGPPLRSDKKNGEDYVHWMVFVLHYACTTANYDNGVNQTVMMMCSFLLCNHIILLCTIDSFWTWCVMYYF